MYTQRLDPGILEIPARGYRGVTAYARAKRAQVALSREWARRLAGTGVACHAMHRSDALAMAQATAEVASHWEEWIEKLPALERA